MRVPDAALRQCDAAHIRLHQAMGATAADDPDLRAILGYWSVMHTASAYLLRYGGKLPAPTPNHHENLLAIAARSAQRRNSEVVADAFAAANRHRPLVHRARYITPRVFASTAAAEIAGLAHRLVAILAPGERHDRLPRLADMHVTPNRAPATAWIVYSRARVATQLPASVARDLRVLMRQGRLVRAAVHRDHVAEGLELALTHLARAVGNADNDPSLVAQFSWMGLIAAARALLLAHRVDNAGGSVPRDAARLEVAALCVQSEDADLAAVTRSLYARYHGLVAQGRYLHPGAVPHGAAWRILTEIWPVVAGLSERAQEVAGGFTVHSRSLTLPAAAREVLIRDRGRRHDDDPALDLAVCAATTVPSQTQLVSTRWAQARG
jgi:hypothetical protein